MSLRTVVFWLHLLTGTVAGAVVLVMSLTGVLLAFEPQIVAWAERDLRTVAPPGPEARRLGLGELVARAEAGRPGARATAVSLRAEPGSSVRVAFGREDGLSLDPYTGRVLGAGSRVHAALHVVEDWHRWLGSRAVGRPITGACNAAFLGLALTGLYLWWPRRWNRASLRSVTVPSLHLRGRARDFNWHNAAGSWCAPVIVVLTLTGLVMSYPWASNLLYTLTGNAPPPPPAERPEPPGAAGRGGPSPDGGSPSRDTGADRRGLPQVAGADRAGRALPGDAAPDARRRGEDRGPRWRSRSEGGAGTGHRPAAGDREAGAGQEPAAAGARPGPRRSADDRPVPSAGGSAAAVASDGPGGARTGERRGEGRGSRVDLDALRARAERQSAAWVAITLRLPPRPGGPVTAVIQEPPAWHPSPRSVLTLDPVTAEVIRWEPFAAQNLGRRLRAWVRPIHTGEAGGLAGQAVAAGASAGGAVLVYTGLALAWRRLLRWRARRPSLPVARGSARDEPRRAPASHSVDGVPAP